jgi:hypothetical protein
LANNTNKLLYDEGLEWDGGTPSYVESAYVATRVLKAMPSIQAQHAYVNTMKATFKDRVAHLLSNFQVAALSDSNTMAIAVSKVVQNLPFGLDYKIVCGVTYLRIGFGIHNLGYHLDALVQILEERDVLS